MAPFTFPDPSVQTSIVNPETGDLWIYTDGVWMIDDHHEDFIHRHGPGEGPHAVSGHGDHHLIETLEQEIQSLRNDIIDLRAQLDNVPITSFLILE